MRETTINPTYVETSISSNAAYAAVRAAVDLGRSRDKALVAAVVNASGDLLALLRADGAFKASIKIARDKAHTAAVFKMSTDELAGAFKDNAVVLQGLALRPGVVLFGGGTPIVVNGQVVGGIGVSGGSEDDDRDGARAGLAAVSPG